MYYILYDLNTLRVMHYDTKPLKPQNWNVYGKVEYHNALPPHDWLKVDNIREENGCIVCDLIPNFYPKREPTEKQVAQNRIRELKAQLESTDYQAIKYAEGWLTEEEYAPIKAQRQNWRDEINQLENLLISL